MKYRLQHPSDGFSFSQPEEKTVSNNLARPIGHGWGGCSGLWGFRQAAIGYDHSRPPASQGAFQMRVMRHTTFQP
jgi:hypothetical protein